MTTPTPLPSELIRNAVNRARQTELDSWQRALDLKWLNSRMEDGRMGSSLALIKREAEMEKEFQERTDHDAIVNERARKETALGIEVGKVRHEEVSHLQRRHFLRERDSGLAQLQRKLEAGYNCRDLQQQILHNGYRRLELQALEDKANQSLKTALFDDNQMRDQECREKMERNALYCKDLQQQLVMRQRQRQCQYEDTLIEKKMLEEVLKTISDEDKREMEAKRVQNEKSRREMVTFAQARNAWRLKQRDICVKEEIELQKQRQAVSDRTASVKAETARKMRAKEELCERISAQILAVEAERTERSEIIRLLQEQEYFEKIVQDQLAEKRKVELTRENTKQALNQQMSIHIQQEKEQKVQDLKFRKETEAKVAEGNDVEAQKERKKKEITKKYSVELRRQIEDNARRREKNRIEEQARVQAVWDYHKAWDKEVAQEREKIIEEHVPQLLGYLQAAVINKEDLPAVRAGANKREDLAKLDIESMAISTRPTRFGKCNAQCKILRDY